MFLLYFNLYTKFNFFYQGLDDEKYNIAINKAEMLLEFIKPLSRAKLIPKDDLKAAIVSNIGIAYLELGKFDLALRAFKIDLELSLSR